MDPLKLALIDTFIHKSERSANRCRELAQYTKIRLEQENPNIEGLTLERRIASLSKIKNWDLVAPQRGRPRLAVSFKAYASKGTKNVSNRLDEILGELSEMQNMYPEVISGYVMAIDLDKLGDGSIDHSESRFSDLIEKLTRVTIRNAPAWMPGTLEAFLLIGIRLSGSDSVSVEKLASYNHRGEMDFFKALSDHYKDRFEPEELEAGTESNTRIPKKPGT